MISFDGIEKGSEWHRPELAVQWGLASFHAIARGVFTPRNSNQVVLFVTEEKQEGFTPYEDVLHGDILRAEGEKAHRSDQRIARSKEAGDEVHLFHRKRHHSPFKYLGQVTLESFEPRVEQPSRFVLMRR
jgi:hypothetical protein